MQPLVFKSKPMLSLKYLAKSITKMISLWSFNSEEAYGVTRVAVKMSRKRLV